MDFINAEVDSRSLPAAESVDLHPIHSSYKKILLTEWLLTAIFLLAVSAALIFGISALKNSIGWLIVVMIFLLITGFHLVSITRSFPYLAYAVRDHDVITQKGWIVRSVKICPFNRIQNCSVQSGPLERRQGLASLIIYTAGSAGADMRIPGLLQEEADRLRHFILSKLNSTHEPA